MNMDPSQFNMYDINLLFLLSTENVFIML